MRTAVRSRGSVNHCMRTFALLLFVFTIAMLAYHLASMRLVRRATRIRSALLNVRNLVRFEGVYYLALTVFLVWTHAMKLLVPLLVLGTLHIAFWIASEMRPAWFNVAAGADGRTERVLFAIQIFDWGEALVLFWMAWTLLRWPA